MSYSCRVFDSIARIDRSAWQQVCSLARAPIFMDVRFAAAVEASMQPNCRFWYVIVDDENGRPAACAGLHAMTIDLTDFADPRLAGMIKRLPGVTKFRRLKALFCSMPGAPGDRTIAMTPAANSAQVLAQLDAELDKLGGFIGADTIMYKEFGPADLEWTNSLLGLGYRRIVIPPMHLLPPSFADFSEYCAALRTRYRQQVNRSIRKLKHSGIETKVLTETEEILRLYLPEVHAMYCEMVARSDVKLEIFPIEYYQELTKHLSGQVELVALVKDTRIIAFGWCLYDSSTYHMMYAGLDYSLNRDYDLYFNLMYAGFDRALRKRLQRIHVGQTATVFKSRMGCDSEERYVYAKGCGPVMRPFFYYGAQFVVRKMPPNPPSDIFKRDRPAEHANSRTSRVDVNAD
jgi:predicted N-acyltransferase